MMLSAHPDLDDIIPAMVDLRRAIHARPELGFAEHQTAAAIAVTLRDLGADVHEGIGRTGVVGVLRAGGTPRSIGLRADMDALPMTEGTGLPWASQTHGQFHGCGHDGHVAMLLGAARHLADTRNFDGTVHLIFQPAEEGLGGAKVMIEDGLFTRFPCDRVFALHNWPELPLGTIATRPGPIMAAADRFTVHLTGKGGHAALPHATPDAILAAAALVTQINTIVARRIPAHDPAVISVTQVHGGEAHNVMPEQVMVEGTVRTFDPELQNAIEGHLSDMADGIASSFGVGADFRYHRQYPATVNDAGAAEEALAIAAHVGAALLAPHPAFTSEDFAFMLQECKGAYLWLGQGRGAGSPSLHSPQYDFNDDVMAIGMRLHIALVESFLAA